MDVLGTPIRTIAHQEGLSEDVPGTDRDSRARGAQNAGDDRVRLGACAPAGHSTGVGTTAVLRDACASLMPSYYLERVASARTVMAGEPLRALAERLRTPLFEPDGAFGWVEPCGARRTQVQGQNARGGVPTFQLECGRTQRVSLLEEPSTTRARPSQKAHVSDSDTQLLPHAGRRNDGGRAVLRAEASVDVCRDTGVSRDPPGSPQSAATSIGIGSKGVGWPTR